MLVDSKYATLKFIKNDRVIKKIPLNNNLATYIVENIQQMKVTRPKLNRGLMHMYTWIKCMCTPCSGHGYNSNAQIMFWYTCSCIIEHGILNKKTWRNLTHQQLCGFATIYNFQLIVSKPPRVILTSIWSKTTRTIMVPMYLGKMSAKGVKAHIWKITRRTCPPLLF